MSSLKQQMTKSTLWGMMGSGGQQLFSFIIFVYLGRVLSPTDFGIMALGAVFIDVLGTLGRFGQIEALQQPKTLDDSAASTSFWLLQAFGLAQMLGLWLAAHPIADFFAVPELALILQILAPICLLQTLGSVHEAFLRRSFGFKALANRNLFSTLGGGLIAVAMVYYGYGLYALAVQRLIYALLVTLLVWLSYRWLPAFSFDLRAYRRLVHDGYNIVISSLAMQFTPRIVDGMVGYFMGTQALGLLKMSWRIYDFVMVFALMPLNNVALPALSKVKDDLPELNRTLDWLFRFSALGLLPVYCGIAAVAPLLVPFVFGAQWAASVPLIQLSSLMSLSSALNTFPPAALLALDRSTWVSRSGIFQALLTLLFCVMTIPFGLTAVVIGYVVRSYVISAVNLLMVRRLSGYVIGDMLVQLAPSLTSACLMMAATFAVHALLPTEWPITGKLVAMIAAGILAYPALVLALCPDLMADLRKLRRR